MLKTSIKKCKKCGKNYIWKMGGIVASPRDYADRDLCQLCRITELPFRR